MGAWRLRAFVYGMLALVSALVLWQSGAFAGEPDRPRALEGFTRNGYPVYVWMHDRDVVSVQAPYLSARCTNGRRWALYWRTSTDWPRVTYHRDGADVELHDIYGTPLRGGGHAHMNVYLRAAVSDDGLGIDGRIRYVAGSSRLPCVSKPIEFSARP